LQQNREIQIIRKRRGTKKATSLRTLLKAPPMLLPRLIIFPLTMVVETTDPINADQHVELDLIGEEHEANPARVVAVQALALPLVNLGNDIEANVPQMPLMPTMFMVWLGIVMVLDLVGSIASLVIHIPIIILSGASAVFIIIYVVVVLAGAVIALMVPCSGRLRPSQTLVVSISICTAILHFLLVILWCTIAASAGFRWYSQIFIAASIIGAACVVKVLFVITIIRTARYRDYGANGGPS
jgi:hypothetical protein